MARWPANTQKGGVPMKDLKRISLSFLLIFALIAAFIPKATVAEIEKAVIKVKGTLRCVF